jgi:hypothetical protein
MTTRSLGYDPLTGVQTNFIDNKDGTFTIHSKQEVYDLIEANKAAFNSVDAKSGWQGEWHHVASIPLTTYFELKKQGVIDDARAFKRWLNSSDHRAFRVRPGQV